VVSPRRVLVAEVGDGDVRRLVEVASRAWRDAGFEVIRLGLAAPEAVAEAALQEDVDAITLPGASADVTGDVETALDGRGLHGVAVLGAAELPDPHDPTAAAALTVAIERAARHPEPEPAP
jgi:methylmalonyl-CoA mutase cobalamin-binding domain/chain